MRAVSLFATTMGLSALGSLGGLAVSSAILLLEPDARHRLIPWLVSYAVGTMLGAALLAILPEVVEQMAPARVFEALLGGILLFFVLEKFVLWRHCHEAHGCETHDATASLVLIGDGFHNFVDGAMIAAAVMTSVPLGVSAAIAVAAHEIPQEVGDFAILLHSGYSRRRALLLNVLSGVTGLAGALVAFFAFDLLPHVLPYFLSVAAASFLYIALSDLIPNLHEGHVGGSSFRQLVVVGAGVGTVALLRTI